MFAQTIPKVLNNKNHCFSVSYTSKIVNEEDNGQLFEPREYYNFNIIDNIQRGKRVGMGVLLFCLYVWWKKPLYIFLASLMMSRPKVQESGIAPLQITQILDYLEDLAGVWRTETGNPRTENDKINLEISSCTYYPNITIQYDILKHLNKTYYHERISRQIKWSNVILSTMNLAVRTSILADPFELVWYCLSVKLTE